MANDRLQIVNPASLDAPKGFSHGVLAPAEARWLFVAGQVGTESTAPGAPAPNFPWQFGRALDRVLVVVREAGGQPADVVRMTVYVTNLKSYVSHREVLGEEWRRRFGRYYPAMTLVEVKSLVDEGAAVEIEATAMIGARG